MIFIRKFKQHTYTLRENKMQLEEVLEKCVFRYRAMNKNTMKEVLNSTIWHSTIEGLNDPFEFPISLDWKELEKKDAETLTKYALFFSILPQDEIIHYIVNNDLETMYNIIKSNLDKFKVSLPEYCGSLIVSCFSEKHDSPLMWSHYSDGMKGLCIAYDKEKLESSSLFKLYPVEYNLNPIQFDYKDLKLIRAVDDFKYYDYEKNIKSIGSGFFARLKSYQYLYQKHKRWEYESELRNIIDPDASKSNPKKGELIDYPREAVRGIIIGSKMSNIHKRLVRKYCTMNDIPIFLAKPNFEDYSVHISDL